MRMARSVGSSKTDPGDGNAQCNKRHQKKTHSGGFPKSAAKLPQTRLRSLCTDARVFRAGVNVLGKYAELTGYLEWGGLNRGAAFNKMPPSSGEFLWLPSKSKSASDFHRQNPKRNPSPNPQSNPRPVCHRWSKANSIACAGETCSRPCAQLPRGGTLSLDGPFGCYMHAPEIGEPIQQLAAFCRFKTRLPKRLVGVRHPRHRRVWKSQYEFFVHAREGEAAGIKPETIRALKAGRAPQKAPRDERALYDFITELHKKTAGLEPQLRARAETASAMAAWSNCWRSWARTRTTCMVLNTVPRAPARRRDAALRRTEGVDILPRHSGRAEVATRNDASEVLVVMPA